MEAVDADLGQKSTAEKTGKGQASTAEAGKSGKGQGRAAKAEQKRPWRLGFAKAAETDTGQESTVEAVKSDRGQASAAEIDKFANVAKFDKGQETFEWTKTAGMFPEGEEPFEKMTARGAGEVLL